MAFKSEFQESPQGVPYFSLDTYHIHLTYVVQSLSGVGLFCDAMDCSPPGSSVLGISQARILVVGCHFLLQEIFPMQGSKPSLLHWQADSLLLSHQGSPIHDI